MTSVSVYFKIEKLDSSDNVIAELTPILVDGEVKVAYDDINRRTCTFSLLEALPDDWMSARWKLYYGTKLSTGLIHYQPLGVFIPLNPEEKEVDGGFVTKYQGVDKAQILADSYNAIPTTFLAGTTLKEVATTIFGLIPETKLNLEDVPYTLATDFTFEEAITLEHILSTLVRSFPADWYYDVNGYAVLESLPVAEARPVKYTFTEDDNSIFIDTTKSVNTNKYWNKVLVIGGTAKTGIFRQVYQNDEQYAKAGRWITKNFKEDAATSQAQVNDLATQFLDAGIRLPANISIHNIPLADLEPKQIIIRNNIKYEVIEFNIPLDLSLQTIQAGELI